MRSWEPLAECAPFKRRGFTDLYTFPKRIYLRKIIIAPEGIKMASQEKAEPAQQPQYPVYGPPQYQPAHKPPIEYIKPFASDVILAIAVVVGLFFLMLGSVIHGTADDNTGRDAGMVLKAFGLFIMTAGMLLGALLRNDMNKWVRVALLLTAALMIVLIGFWGSFWGLTVDLSLPGYT